MRRPEEDACLTNADVDYFEGVVAQLRRENDRMREFVWLIVKAAGGKVRIPTDPLLTEEFKRGTLTTWDEMFPSPCRVVQATVPAP